MPPPTKLHAKGKASSIQKPLTSPQEQISPESHEEQDVNRMKFELELCWCIQKLEKALTDKSLSEKRLQETWKILTILKNSHKPIIQKRQLMRTQFGDYRAKMADEEKKLVKLTKGMKITEKPSTSKATFIRKSAFQSTGDASFRFNFSTPQLEAHTSQQAKHPEGHNTDIVSATDNSKTFKFKFSGSEFKFNFDPSSNH